jgi:hypothetical protein
MNKKLSIFGGAILMFGMAGCASVIPPGTLARTAPTPFYTIDVEFDGNGCPTAVSHSANGTCGGGLSGICVDRGRAVQWRSDPGSTMYPFKVYFDPFVGAPYESRGPDEKTNPAIVPRDAKPGEYKYSVFGDACTGPNPILDPAFRVNP